MRFRRYLPKLKGFPSRYIYEPWNAPESIQKAAKCVIGVDYPRPIVNHAEASRLNIERMKQVYQQLSRYRGLCKDHPLIPNRNSTSGLLGWEWGFPDICRGTLLSAAFQAVNLTSWAQATQAGLNELQPVERDRT